VFLLLNGKEETYQISTLGVHQEVGQPEGAEGMGAPSTISLLAFVQGPKLQSAHTQSASIPYYGTSRSQVLRSLWLDTVWWPAW